MKNLIGNRYKRLLVVDLDHVKKYKGKSPQTKPYWLCLCDCGIKKVIRGEHLVSGKILSCGCYAKENTSKVNSTHGMTGTKVYRAWNGIKNRDDRWYQDVKVCDRWLESFENFYKDMGEPPSDKHSIDRIDVYGDYEPGNCRWATNTEQMLNQKRNHNIYKEYKKRNPKVSYSMFTNRVKQLGWSYDKAATLPKQKNQFG